MEIFSLQLHFGSQCCVPCHGFCCNVAPRGMQGSSKRHQPLCNCDTGIRVYDLAVGREENHRSIEEPATKFRLKGVVRRRLIQHHISEKPFLVAFSS